MRVLFLFSFFLLLGHTVAAQTPKVSAGTIRRFEQFPSKWVDARTVDVWLPPGYDARKQYAVLYMHDGQSLFDSTITWNRQEWGVDETLSQLLGNQQIRDCIVVGIWNISSLRWKEYMPQKAMRYLRDDDKKMLEKDVEALFGQGVWEQGVLSDRYLKFLVQELKPFIDKTFSTRKGRKHTFVAGSSMGGLISMYAICEYPKVFGGAACLSTHWVGIFRADNNPLPAAVLGYLRDHLPAPRTHRLYFDYGTATLDALYPPFQKQADVLLAARGFSSNNWVTRAFEGEDHSEKAWARRLNIPVLFLLKKD